jgi:glycosyltransferase involved in cell wall biosynthesis
MNLKRKILLVTNAYPSEEKKYSGIFVKNQYEQLLKLKDSAERIDIFYMTRKITSPVGSIFKYIQFVLRFIPYLFKKYDVIHLHFFYPLILLVYLYKTIHFKTKLVVTFHGSDINIYVNNKNKWFYKKLARKIDVAIPVGGFISNQIKNKLNIDPIDPLPVGINQDVFFKENDVSKVYDLIFVGSFIHVKGIDILYELSQKLDRCVRICVVGKGKDYESKFKTLINNGFDNLTLKIDQSQSELRHLYNRSKYLILLSRSEGFPTVSIESMYCATPVIASNIPQFQEQIRDGQNGFLVSPLNIIDLVPLINNILNLDNENYLKISKDAHNSHRNIELSNICNELLNIYRS